MKMNNNYLKSILFSLSIFVLASCSTSPKGYTLNGKVRGDADSLMVYLEEVSFPEPKIVDSTKIVNGEFNFKGTLEFPTLYRVIIDRTPKGEASSERNWLASNFYLENSTIEYSGHVDSLPTYFYKRDREVQPPVISGSATQDQLIAYNESTSRYNKELRDIDTKYLEVYHVPSMSGVFNTQEGIDLINQQNEIVNKINDVKWNFIKSNPESVVAFDKAHEYLLDMYVRISQDQIDELVANFEPDWKGTNKFDKFKEDAEKAKKTAIGSKYMDFELLTPEGEKVMLSDYIDGKHDVMLEFWASWCGPCRGEIPHLRQVNEEYKDKGFRIVSISIDDVDSEWRKAMSEEKMVWTQLNDPKGFEGEISKAYNILGIPYALLLDKEGRIKNFEMRGASLDAQLQELYGKQ